MVKGVNKNVIEVMDTGNEMFERAILFLRPNGPDFDTERINESARVYLWNLRLRRRWFPRWRPGLALLRYCAAIGFGALLAALFFKF